MRWMTWRLRLECEQCYVSCSLANTLKATWENKLFADPVYSHIDAFESASLNSTGLGFAKSQLIRFLL